MIRIQAFQTAACEGGFVNVSESEGGNVLWFRKCAPHSAKVTHQPMLCIDGLTNRMTVSLMTAPGKVNLKMFRVAAALREWLEPSPETIRQR
jgi:hypothetical protein